MTADPAPLLHIVCGSTGAGKTTYSMALAERLGGIRFSIDDWMVNLFWKDSPQPIAFDWTIERIERCHTQIREMVAALAARGCPSVLDLGFTTVEQRTRFAEFAHDLGTSAALHWLDVDPERRWQRVLERNRTRGASYALAVDRAMFDFMEGIWEPPSPAELAACAGEVIRS